ncbi:MAG: SDR family NAD(P)-dependent oxidoreductase [Novosphingobium sp.]
MGSLTGKVALVTGASRGIGKGIALALADQGATVYVTGRTALSGQSALPGSLEETVREVDRRGGKGIAVQLDHGDDDAVAALFVRIADEQQRLDILVNNAFAVPDHLPDLNPYWEQPLSDWRMVDVGVRSSYVAAWHAAKIMVPQKSGLIVAISGYTGVSYTFNVVFGMCKSAVDRMARDMAIELEPHNVASLSLWQGFTFTELARAAIEQRAGLQRSTVTNPAVGSSPEFPGKVIGALATDPRVMRHSGGTFITAELAQEYAITDIDGNAVPSLRAERGAPIWQPITTTVGDAG